MPWGLGHELPFSWDWPPFQMFYLHLVALIAAVSTEPASVNSCSSQPFTGGTLPSLLHTGGRRGTACPHPPESETGSCLSSETALGCSMHVWPGFLSLWDLDLSLCIGSASETSHILINGSTWAQAKISYSVVYYSITNHSKFNV